MSLITLEPDMDIEPGHQWIVIDPTAEGIALAQMLDREQWLSWDAMGEAGSIRIAHKADVDRRIRLLIDELAAVRFSAPGLVQMTLQESMG